MGHTALSQRRVLDLLLTELGDYGRALRPEEREALAEVLREPLKHIGAISHASSINTWAFLLLAVCVEQQKRIKELEHAVGGRVPEREGIGAVAQEPGELAH